MQKISAYKNIAVFGGKFDPPHLVHQIIIFLLLERYAMEHVLVIPSYSHPFAYEQTNFSIRMKMCHILVDPWKKSKTATVSGIEEELGTTPVYTIDLLEELEKRYDAFFHIAMGEDNWKNRDKWKDFKKVEKKASPVIIGRGDGNDDEFFPLPNISSTLIRKRMKENKSSAHLLPVGMESFINKNNLYREKKNEK